MWSTRRARVRQGRALTPPWAGEVGNGRAARRPELPAGHEVREGVLGRSREVRPYRELLADTIAWCDPAPGDQWLDLGCGSGPSREPLCGTDRAGPSMKSSASTCAAVNDTRLRPAAGGAEPVPRGPGPVPVPQLQRRGSTLLPNESFDHAVSGLSISYAESYSEALGRWTDEAYDRVLDEVYCVPSGRGPDSCSRSTCPSRSGGGSGCSRSATWSASARPLRFLKRAPCG